MSNNEPAPAGDTADKRTVALTGGHFSPAYAVVEALEAAGNFVQFFGRTQAFSEGQSPTIEHSLIGPNPQVTFISIPGARLNMSVIQNFFISFFSALKYFSIKRPEYIISFGGYLAIPVCVAGWILRIPIYLHEQTIAPGKANQFLMRFSRKVYLAFPEAAQWFPHEKTRLIGNPYHSAFFKPQAPAWFNRNNNRPLLLIIGGSSGAHNINELFRKDIDILIQKYQIVHQIGSSIYNDYEQLQPYQSDNYYPVKQLLPQEIAFFMDTADLCVTRSGANTFFLLVHYALPSILIPLPIAPNDEQRKHAQVIAQVGAGIIMEESGSADTLSQLCEKLYASRIEHAQAYQKLGSYNSLIISGATLLTAITQP
ncbi:MAG: glycosyltransferase [Candidatus Roizmanbacteria bacterium]|nr:glycosyltransferase [Candidatus Roizmanbacteria bacterium]